MDAAIPKVSRRLSRGVPRYTDRDVFVLSGTEELTEAAREALPQGGWMIRYRPRMASQHQRIEQHIDAQGVAHWQVYDADGAVHHFGMDGGDRLADPKDTARILT